MPTRQAQLRRRNLAMVALFAAFWPMPYGIGYLFLKQWGKVVVVSFWLFIGQGLLMAFIGPSREVFGILHAIIWIATIVDTWRLVIDVGREPLEEG